jgi:hypothetical protein
VKYLTEYDKLPESSICHETMVRVDERTQPHSLGQNEPMAKIRLARLTSAYLWPRQIGLSSVGSSGDAGKSASVHVVAAPWRHRRIGGIDVPNDVTNI